MERGRVGKEEGNRGRIKEKERLNRERERSRVRRRETGGESNLKKEASMPAAVLSAKEEGDGDRGLTIRSHGRGKRVT